MREVRLEECFIEKNRSRIWGRCGFGDSKKCESGGRI